MQDRYNALQVGCSTCAGHDVCRTSRMLDSAGQEGSVQDGCRTSRMNYSMDVLQHGCITGRMQDRTDAGQDGCRTVRMQGRADAGQEGCRTGRMQYVTDAGQVGFSTGRMQDKTDAGQDGCRTGRMQPSFPAASLLSFILPFLDPSFLYPTPCMHSISTYPESLLSCITPVMHPVNFLKKK